MAFLWTKMSYLEGATMHKFMYYIGAREARSCHIWWTWHLGEQKNQEYCCIEIIPNPATYVRYILEMMT